jgi:hypothetical protein
VSADRELLELAAKAAGIDLHVQDDGSTGYYSDWRGMPQWEAWNPLADDGDALRLAVKLGMALNVCKRMQGDDYTVVLGGGGREEHGSDEFAATRRAIVRAAAEICRATTQTESKQP